MQYTKNLCLKKPESTDSYNVDDFNENMEIIDTKLKDLIVVEKHITRVYSESQQYNIGKDGYIPMFVKVNVLHSTSVVCRSSQIYSGESGYYVDYNLYNTSTAGVSDEVEIVVLYVRDI